MSRRIRNAMCIALLGFGVLVVLLVMHRAKTPTDTEAISHIAAGEVGTNSPLASKLAEQEPLPHARPVIGADTGDISKLEHAKQYGALGKLTLRVVDSQGEPVSGADVASGFVVFEQGASQQHGTTDSNGMLSIEGLVSWMIGWTITKDGYYTTVGDYLVQRGSDPNSVQNGRWQPWNPTVEVVLKEKRDPVQLISGGPVINSKQLPHDAHVGYDCLIDDFIAPYGRGEMPDIYFLLNSEWHSSYIHTNKLTISASGGGWLSLLAKDSYSELAGVYAAPEDGDAVSIQYEYARTKERVLVDQRMASNEYLVFKSVRPNSDGITEVHFGILSDVKFGGGWIKFKYLINPTPDNRNLEMQKGKPWSVATNGELK